MKADRIARKVTRGVEEAQVPQPLSPDLLAKASCAVPT